MRGSLSSTIVLLMLMFALAGCLDAGSEVPGGDVYFDEDPEPTYVGYTELWAGEFVAAGVDAAIEYQFEVPNGTTEVAGLLTWRMPGAILDFALIDPHGNENGNGWGESSAHRYVTTPYVVAPGPWTAVVTAERGVDVHFDFSVEARIAEPFGPIAGSYEIQPETFGEINLNMAPDELFNFSWTSDADVYYNVHFHGNGGTERPIEHTGTSLEGNFTAPAYEVYSMLWRNEGLLPVTVEYEVDGVYRLHSMTRDAPAHPSH